jgi:murein DD-endopeptidase MepM/ murein hydrolase activator NlpD
MKNSNSKVLNYLRQNAVYLILALCIIAIGLSVTLMLVNRDKIVDNQLSAPIITPDDNDEKEEETVKIVSFIMPIANALDIGEYSEQPVFNDTLDRYSSHMAMDFFAEEGTSVCAVYDGVVESVTSTLLQGTTVVIDHGDGLKTSYNSLADGDMVTVGQTVKQGDIIGELSTSNRQESHTGAHLHFSVTENGQAINPSKYLVFDEK